MQKNKGNVFVLGILLGMALMGSLVAGAVLERRFGLNTLPTTLVSKTREVVDEESVVTNVVSKSTPSVVTVAVVRAAGNVFPGFEVGGLFGLAPQKQPSQSMTQDIGSGFVISADGMIVTNKHVVEDTTAKYKVIVGNDKTEYDVKQIYRDPVNDLAILKIDKTGLTPLTLGDSDKIMVGQTVIAIGTALGEFRSTVTKGVISGLGRGIDAGSPFQGTERLDNVIQTDAAINPGNSGGPLINASGEAIGVDVATSESGQSIGFALPINLVKESIANFKSTGSFDRPFLGVSYRMISKQAALMNDVPAGALVQGVIDGSPAKIAGILIDDIITEFNGQKLVELKDTQLSPLVAKTKIGESVKVKLWRGDKGMDVTVKMDKKQS
jgi:serine protease Do